MPTPAYMDKSRSELRPQGNCAAIAAVAGIALMLMAILAIYTLATYNVQQRLSNQYTAKVAANKTELSNLKAKFAEAAAVTTEQMASLEKIFVAHADARTKKGDAALMTWVQETVPNVDQDTFKELQRIVVSSRDDWTTRQTELVDIARTYNTNLDTQPSGLVLSIFGDFPRLEPAIVVSAGTQEAFRTGTDEPVELFPGPKALEQ